MEGPLLSGRRMENFTNGKPGVEINDQSCWSSAQGTYMDQQKK